MASGAGFLMGIALPR